MSTLETRIAEVLKAHQLSGLSEGLGTECVCGWESPSRGIDREAHRTHVAAALAPVIAEAQADLVDALADLLDEYQASHDVAECAAYVEGETGRQACIDTWEAITEEPAEWLRKKAAEHRGHERDHLQDMLFEAWESGHESGHTDGYHDYQAQRGLAEPLEHETNPYRSNDE